MIRLLDEIRKLNEDTKKLLEKGQIKVEVTKLPTPADPHRNSTSISN